MEIVLLERIAKLGQIGDVVRVRDGYARNFLLPKKKAMRATPENLKVFEQQRSELEARNLAQKTEAEAVAGRLSDTQYVAIRQAGVNGQLYGSVTTRDIVTTLGENDVVIERYQVQLATPIKSIGLHSVTLALHPEVNCNIIMNVARSEDEATRQARGENVLDADADVDADDVADADEEGAIAAADIFERQEDVRDAQTAALETQEAGDEPVDDTDEEASAPVNADTPETDTPPAADDTRV